MQSSRKLLLHIGSHKTGSTTLQRTLYANRSHLLEQGWSVFCAAPDGKVSRKGNANAWINERVAGGSIRQGFAQQLGRMTGDVVVSSEGFSWLFSQDVVSGLATEVSQFFDRIQIVVYIRRQDLMALSHYQQASKSKPAQRFYGAGNRGLPLYQESYQALLNYHQRLSLWAEAFGEQSLSIRIFDRTALEGGDVVDDFAFVSELSLPERVTWRNVSNGFEKTKVAHLMTRVKMPRHIRKKIEAVLDNSGKLLPSAPQAWEFYQHFRAGNKALNARFRISQEEYLFDEDFSMYPDSPGDTWAEESANQAIGNILQAVKSMRYLPADDAATVRESGEALAAKDPELAKWLLELAATADRAGL